MLALKTGHTGRLNGLIDRTGRVRVIRVIRTGNRMGGELIHVSRAVVKVKFELSWVIKTKEPRANRQINRERE